MDKQLGAGLSACHTLTNLLFIFRQDVPVRLPSVSSIYHRHARRTHVACIPIDKMLLIQLSEGILRKQLICLFFFFFFFFLLVVFCNEITTAADSIFVSLFVSHSVCWNYVCKLVVTLISCLKHERKPLNGALPLFIKP